MIYDSIWFYSSHVKECLKQFRMNGINAYMVARDINVFRPDLFDSNALKFEVHGQLLRGSLCLKNKETWDNNKFLMLLDVLFDTILVEALRQLVAKYKGNRAMFTSLLFFWNFMEMQEK